VQCDCRSRLTGLLVLTLALPLAGCTRANIHLRNDAGDGPSPADGNGSDHASADLGGGDHLPGTGGGGGGGGGVGGAAGVGSGGAAGTGSGGVAGAGSGGSAGTGMGGAAGAIDAGMDGPTGITPTVAGQLVITEIMADVDVVSDDVGEWFEIYNPSLTNTYDLFGCLLLDSSTTNQDTVDRHVIVAPGRFITMGRWGDASGGFIPNFNYHVVPGATTDVKFKNSGDKVRVVCSGVDIDVVDFTSNAGWPAAVTMSYSYSLDPRHYDASENDVYANWCLGTIPYYSVGGTVDRGTPGASNPYCPTD
jgi:hypothetical protein